MTSTVSIQNQTRPDALSIHAKYCASFFSRLRGYMFTSNISLQEGLLLVESRENRVDTSIHMFFMAFDLGVIWINRQGIVVDTCLAKCWRPYYAPTHPALYVLETHPDRLNDFKVGDQVNIAPC